LTIGAAEGGGFAITGITGTFDGSTITGLVNGSGPPNPSGNGGTCDARASACLPAYLNEYGMLFSLSAPPPTAIPTNGPAIYVISYTEYNNRPGDALLLLVGQR
jgi:hypothetical protein